MILSGWNRSATCRANRRITRMGTSGPDYATRRVPIRDFFTFFRFFSTAVTADVALIPSPIPNAAGLRTLGPVLTVTRSGTSA
jgi:hypothetical protein